ncbi:hypothetical protein HD593_001858 [Nonomuraea rubra]|uniref:Uncharacterized protein n=1 Tax=Nonomuraea rubra TaxID=46180 RepID=A0A7X0TX59_9ACTN|nr:hypothetical protein [Nonomuraea rubra]
MGAAALPARARQGGADRLDQAAVRVGDDQLHPGQAAGDQAAQERQPTGAVLGRGDLQAEHLALAVGVDAGGHQRVHVDRAAALTHLLGQGVDPDEGVRAGVQGACAEGFDLLIQHLGHLRDLALGDVLDAELLDQLVHPPGGDAEQVAGGHHADQRLLGPPPSLQQPVRVVRARAQLRNRQLDRARPGVPLARPVAVTGVGPLVAALPVGGPAQAVGLGRHQRLGHGLHHGSQQIRVTGLDLLRQPPLRRHTVVRGHRRSPSWNRCYEGSRDDRSHFTTPHLLTRSNSYTTSADATWHPGG